MNAQVRNELCSIKQELQSVISELESISEGVSREFDGIGEQQCSAAINKVVNYYYWVKRRLDNMDTTTNTFK